MLLLVLGIAVFLLALVVGGRAEGRAPLFWVGCAYLLPAAFLAWVLFSSQGDATRFRFALLGLGFRSEEGEPLTVPIGGDRMAHPIWVSALSEGPSGTRSLAGQVVFTPAAESQTAGTVVVETAPTRAPGFLAARQGPRSPMVPVEGVKLQQGDRVTYLGRTWTVQLDTGRFGPPAMFLDAAGRPVELPANFGKLPGNINLPIERALPPTEKTYPLGWLQKFATRNLPADAPPAFFYRRAEGPFRSSLWIAAPAGSARIERGGKELPLGRSVQLTAGDSLHIVSFGAWNGRSFTAGGMRDRRSFKILTGRRSFAVAYETPEIYALPWSRVQELSVAPVADAEGKEVLRVTLSMGDWQMTDKSLYFDHASHRVAGEALAILELPKDLAGMGTAMGAGEDETISAATPRGYQRSRLGAPLWLGGENRAAVQLDVIRPPLWLALLALGLALVKMAAARAARLSGAQTLAAAALESLVCLRILLGYRAWAMPPYSEEAYRLALVAWAILPWAFLVAAAPPLGRGDLRLRERLPLLAGLAFSAAWCARVDGEGLRWLLWVLCHGGVAALLLRGLLPVRGGVAFLRGTGSLLLRLVPVRLERFLHLRADGWSVVGWSFAGFVPSLFRGFFLALGAREGARIAGQRFALTIVHVPLAIVLEAGYLLWLWRRVEDRGRLAWTDLLPPSAAFVLGTWLGPAGLVSDLGLALLHLPVFLAALTVLGLALARRLTEEGGRGRWLAALPATALCGYLLFAAFPVGSRLFVNALPERVAVENERNYLRLLEYAYPQRLQAIGIRGSEELAVMSAVMQSYTSRPFRECHYFSSVISPHIRATALREHATAVLIAAEWSVAGSIGVLLLYVAVALGGFALVPWHKDRGDGSGAGLAAGIAQLAALSFAIPSIYMILANYRLTLFTGKNPYLLGLDSTADLLESLALALLFALATAAVRDAEDDI